MDHLLAWLAVGLLGSAVSAFIGVHVTRRTPRLLRRGAGALLGPADPTLDVTVPRLVLPAGFAIAALLSAAVILRFPNDIAIGGGLLVTWVLVMACIVDLRHLILPDVMTLPLLWIGLVAASTGHATATPVEAIQGAAAGWLVIALPRMAILALRGSVVLGRGDVKLMAACGAWLGPWPMADILIIGAVLAMIVMTAGRLIRGGAPPEIPFGPYLAAAAWVSLMAGGPILLSLMGAPR